MAHARLIVLGGSWVAGRPALDPDVESSSLLLSSELESELSESELDSWLESVVESSELELSESDVESSKFETLGGAAARWRGCEEAG